MMEFKRPHAEDKQWLAYAMIEIAPALPVWLWVFSELPNIVGTLLSKCHVIAAVSDR